MEQYLVKILALGLLCVVMLMSWLCARRWRKLAIMLEQERQIHAQERQIVLQFLHSFVEAIGEGVGREELFRRVAHCAVSSTGALSACVFELRGRDLVAAAVEGMFPPLGELPRGVGSPASTRARFIEEMLRTTRIPLGHGLVGEVARTGSGILVADAAADSRIQKIDDPAFVLRSLIVVPVHFQNKVIAVLAIANPADGSQFTRSDFSLALGIAEQAGLAIHNIDLTEAKIERNKMDVDLALASSIQSMLLPKKMPGSEVIDVAPLYLPAQKVGGDLYDIFPIDDTRYGMAVADVSGKGVPASIIMAICQSNLRHLARSGISPAQVLSDLNAVMREEMRRDMFVTVLYAIVDTAADTLTIARAGHELPVLLFRNEQGEVMTDFIQSGGMAIGMAREKLFDKLVEEKTLPFRKGDILVMYTDGITEAMNRQGAHFGPDRLL